MTIDAPRLLQVSPPQTRSMTTRDGARLDADIYRPAEGGPYPVLLMRQAYGRRIACTICYAHPAWYAAHGYVVVVQDMRGRGTSQGAFRFAEDDIEDGAQTIEWCSALEGTTGEVGMYGFSYQGSNQLMAAAGAGPALRALAPAMFSWNVRQHWAYENNAFRLGGGLGWAIQIAAETARHAGDEDAFAELHAAARAVPFNTAVSCRPELMERHRHLSHYHAWLDTPLDDPYWARVSPSHQLEAISARQLPMLIIGGWYDSHLRGTLEGFKAIAAANVAPTRLVVGPWLHFPWDRKAGPVDFGPAAASAMDVLQIRWYDHWLKGRDASLVDEAPIQMFDLGAKLWRAFEHWPDKTRVFALFGTGAASIDASAGRLLAEPVSPAPGVEYLVHDPWRPAPSVGGTYGSPPGPVDRAAIDARGDVLTFTTQPFADAELFAGGVSASLRVTSDAPSFDLGCVLSLVLQNGFVMPLADGYHCVKPGGAEAAIDISLGATCVQVQAGQALRLSISGAAFPAFPVNPGTGDDPAATPLARARITTTGIQFGDGAQSMLRVGVVD